ncbi:copper transporter [Arsenicicoccus dermatophilus]|uniref:copper transporter n=1 Tax=Arsenicicoccus dermatophilus TaxID=1076331 RepID=UPI001F4D2FEB|nr:copper transporter [Arsenicicoccus dermatophilus]
MIDFRYHLVSIIAIFMALAVGIVLGAGPLKEDIGATLTAELTKLRQDKVVLNDQLAQSRKNVAAGQTYATATRSEVLKDRLSGRRVDVVVAAGADEPTVGAVQSALVDAGATVPAVVRLDEQWTHPEVSGDLAATVSDLAPTLGLKVDSVPAEQLPGMVLGRALLTSPAKDGWSRQGPAAQAAPNALSVLRSKGLLSLRGAAVEPATLVVAVAAPMTRAGTQPTDPQTQAYAGLVQALDLVGEGATLVSPSRPAEDPDSTSAAAVVSAVRNNRAVAAAVTTVDDADLAMGQVATVVGLQGQLTGEAGRYGIGPDAEAVVPELTR